MKFISLFSGIGGFDLGFERAGMTCDTVCEIDKASQKVLRRHFPHARIIDDVKKVGKETHGRKSVDLICGGFPCQDVSIAGKREGLAGKRSGLWFEFARIIDELEPKWVVIENVPGLLSSNRGLDFAEIIQWLVKRGYGVCWRILDAKYFGVAQERRRLFVVASFRSGAAAQALFEQECKTEIRPLLPKTYTGTILTRYSQRWDDSETIVRDSDGDRWLNPMEVERLQGFPDGWTDRQSDSARYRQLGNAVAVPVAEWIGNRIFIQNKKSGAL